MQMYCDPTGIRCGPTDMEEPLYVFEHIGPDQHVGVYSRKNKRIMALYYLFVLARWISRVRMPLEMLKRHWHAEVCQSFPHTHQIMVRPQLSQQREREKRIEEMNAGPGEQARSITDKIRSDG